MKSSPIKAALLVVLATLLGFLVFRSVTRFEQAPVLAGSDGPELSVEGTELGEAETESVPIADPTPDLAAVEPRPNSQVIIQVANGSNVNGQGRWLTDKLRNAGFSTRQATNAPDRTQSVIHYAVGYMPEAEQARQVLNSETPIVPMPDPVPNIEGADLTKINVFVWIGSDELSSRTGG